MPDWFTQNAPHAPASPPPSEDWFAQNQPAAAPPSAAGWYQGAADAVVGAAKGAAHTVETLGKWLHDVPGGSTAVDAAYGMPGLSKAAFAAADEMTRPTTAPQKVGYGAEQMGEFLIPAAPAEKAAARVAEVAGPAFRNAPRLVQAVSKVAPRAAVEAATAGGTAAAQGQDAVPAALIGGMGAAVAPALEAGAAATLKTQAAKQVEEALGATKERFKAMAQKIAPEVLKRGLVGSREGLAQKAAEATEIAGQQIDDALKQYGGRMIETAPLVQALEKAKDAFRDVRRLSPADAIREGLASPTSQGLALRNGATLAADGMVEMPIALEPRALAQLGQLQGVIKQYGDSLRADQLVKVRRVWDDVVAQAGGYAHRAPGGIGIPLQDASEAATKREATTAIRQLLSEKVPELTALNKEYSFWKSLDDVLTQTLQRKGPQGPGLGKQVAEVAGAAAGSGHGIGAAFALGKLSKLANAVFTSPRWQLASAQMKDKLATAIVKNDLGEVSAALSRILAGGSSVVPAVTGGGQ